ncbi:MAG: restriction endonuclease subunit R [Bacteroidetes bacterium SW_9_63_38]|nr:MAG: restriction endonuclease subunit R [Bacteroidetes bacterium SW_9_63_38]
MESLNLPTYDVHVIDRDDTRIIYDPVRQTYVTLTPEEWVRQHFLQYLMQELNVPAGLVATEASFQYEGQTWRADIVAYDRQGNPLLLVECKAPSVSIGQNAFDQGARYNLVLDAPFLVVTNGRTHYACRIDLEEESYAFLDDLPEYRSLLADRA